MANGIAITVDGEPDAELVQAGQIEVLECVGEATQYQLIYSVDISEGDFPMLVDGRLNPGVELALLATTDSDTACLVQGPIYAHDIQMKHGGAGSTLTVMGADSRIKMDRENKSTQWADLTDSDAVTAIFSSYGFVPDVESTNAGHFTDKHTLIQRDTDLNFVNRLARRNGFLFWVSCDENLIEVAHFKKPELDGDATSDLIINLDGATLDELSIQWDVERPTSVQATQLDLNSLSDIDGELSDTTLTILGNQNLQSITGDTRETHIHTPADDSGDLQARSEGLLNEAQWFLRARCATSVTRLGIVIRAHQLVNLRGAGSRYSGTYYVVSVRHIIDSASHVMEINLVRNGWL